MANRKVVYTRLHVQLYIPGVGDLGTVFPSQSKTLDNLQMSTSESTLRLSFAYRGLKKELLVPHGNVVSMELAPEETAVPIKLAKAG